MTTKHEVKLPKPSRGLLVLTRGRERKIFVGQAFLGGGMKDATTTAAFSWDEEGLEVMLDCADKSIVAVQGAGRDNPEAWKDDCVELLLDPGHKHGTPILVLVSAAGAVCDARGADTSYRIEGLRARTIEIDGGWRATISIPWQGLGVSEPRDGEIWGINIRRIDYTDAFSLEDAAEGSWMPCHTDTRDVLKSGHIAFMLPGSAEDDGKLSAMRDSLAAGNAAAVRAWAGPNDGDVIVLGEEAVTIPHLVRITSGVQPRQGTRVTLERNDEALVVTFDCDDEDIFAEQEGEDNLKLWRDDCVYVWLDPTHSHEADEAIMVQVSAAGVVCVTRGGDTSWDLEGLVAKTERTETGWTAHLVLPFKGLLTPNAAFGRNQVGQPFPACSAMRSIAGRLADLVGQECPTYFCARLPPLAERGGGQANRTELTGSDSNASPLATLASREAGSLWGLNLARMDQPGVYDYARMQLSSLVTIPGDGALAAVHRWGHLAFGTAADPADTPSHVARRKAVDERLVADAAAAKAEKERLAAYRGIPANPHASEDVRKIVKWFTGLPTRKGKRFVVAQDIWCYDTIDGKEGMDAGYIRFMESIHERTGKWLPMVHVSYGDPTAVLSDPVRQAKWRAYLEQANKHAIAQWKGGGLVHIHTNANNPFTGVYDGSPNRLAHRERIAEVLEPGSDANKAWMGTLDAWAELLTELRDNGVVALWRPLHEMGFEACYWYDWGATRSGEPYKKIWKHMFQYYNEEKKLDNLVWVWGGGGAHSLECYPGPEFVDIVGSSHYGSDVVGVAEEYEEMLSYGKIIGFTEFGPGGKEEPAFDNLELIRAVQEQYPEMSSATYWHSWTGVRTAVADCRNVEALMNHPLVYDRDSLDWREVEV